MRKWPISSGELRSPGFAIFPSRDRKEAVLFSVAAIGIRPLMVPHRDHFAAVLSNCCLAQTRLGLRDSDFWNAVRASASRLSL